MRRDLLSLDIIGRLKGEHLIKGVQDWGETKISASALFEKNTSFKRNKPFDITSTKFVQKLRELNKGKHNYDYLKETNRPYYTIWDHT